MPPPQASLTFVWGAAPPFRRYVLVIEPDDFGAVGAVVVRPSAHGLLIAVADAAALGVVARLGGGGIHLISLRISS